MVDCRSQAPSIVKRTWACTVFLTKGGKTAVWFFTTVVLFTLYFFNGDVRESSPRVAMYDEGSNSMRGAMPAVRRDFSV